MGGEKDRVFFFFFFLGVYINCFSFLFFFFFSPLFFHILIKSSLEGHRGMWEVQYPLFIKLTLYANVPAICVWLIFVSS